MLKFQNSNTTYGRYGIKAISSTRHTNCSRTHQRKIKDPKMLEFGAYQCIHNASLLTNEDIEGLSPNRAAASDHIMPLQRLRVLLFQQ
jgi:hypothetical protein